MAVIDAVSQGRRRQHELVREPRRSPAQAVAHERRRRSGYALLGIGVPLVLLTLWQVAAMARWIDPVLYTPPIRIVQSAVGYLSTGELWTDIGATFTRIIVGFTIGAVSGIAVGALTGTSRVLRAALEPTLSALYVIPKLALLPVFIVMVGLGDPPLLLIVTITVFFYMWIYTMEAFSGIADGYLDAARSLNAGRLRTFTRVMFPAVLPQIFVAARVAITAAVLVIVASEMTVGNTGLGYVIFNSRALFLNDRMYVGILLVSIMGVVLALAISRLGRVLTPWAKHGTFIK